MSPGSQAQSPDKTDKGVPSSLAQKFYCYFLDQSSQAEAEGNISNALILARQAELVGLMIMKQQKLPQVTATYARLLLSTCLAARRLAVRSGNITQRHLSMIQDLDTLAGRIRLRLESEDKEQVGRAVMIEGLAVAASATTAEFLNARSLYTPAKTLDQVVSALTQILMHVRHLNCCPLAPFGASTELLSLAGTAIANARHYLCWFWPSRLSDWDKAGFMCQQAALLLSQHSTLEGTTVSHTSAALDQIYPLLRAAEKAVSLRHYKQASRALKLAAQHLATVASP